MSWRVRNTMHQMSEIENYIATKFTGIAQQDFSDWTIEDKQALDERIATLTQKLERVAVRMTAKLWEEKIEEEDTEVNG